MARLLLLLLATYPAFSWENHALPTRIAVKDMPEFSKAALVKAEPLEAFLASTQKDLKQVLEREEAWARANVPEYPARPDRLALQTHHIEKSDFLKAIRINPKISLALFTQEMPDVKTSSKPGDYLKPSEVTLLPNSLTKTGNRFIRIKKSQLVLPLDIFISATDEPDYGLDLNLWGEALGFGEQPFGNPKLEFATQAPFHMGFFHEWRLLYLVAPNIKKTFPEYRIHLYYTLSRFAFETGHPYWGWRFAGWGAHYIQDLTQPYHAHVLPGKNTLKLILDGALDKIGFHGPKERLIQQASDAHLALEEKYYHDVLNYFYGKPSLAANALRQTHSETLIYTPDYVRSTLTLEHHEPYLKGFGEHTRAWVRAIDNASKPF